MVNDAPKRRWLLIALIVSLGLNLFLGSLMVGRWIAGPPHHRGAFAAAERGPAGEPGRILQRMASSLPQEHRPAFEAVMTKHRERIVELAGQARDARQQVRAILNSDTFERAALDRAFENVRTRNLALQAEIQATIGEAAAALPPDARKQLADWRAHARGR
jgi:uncharacterized membrane protein